MNFSWRAAEFEPLRCSASMNSEAFGAQVVIDLTKYEVVSCSSSLHPGSFFLRCVELARSEPSNSTVLPFRRRSPSPSLVFRAIPTLLRSSLVGRTFPFHPWRRSPYGRIRRGRPTIKASGLDRLTSQFKLSSEKTRCSATDRRRNTDWTLVLRLTVSHRACSSESTAKASQGTAQSTRLFEIIKNGPGHTIRGLSAIIESGSAKREAS
jgi:hypothetical protein